jgi:uncharacterized protein (TIGR02246 family)
MTSKQLLVALLFAALIAAIPGHAQEPARRDKKPPAAPTAGRPTAPAAPVKEKESDVFKKSADAFAEAFNKGDAKAVAALWTKDGEYIDDAGERFIGRDAIQQEYASFFKANPGAKISLSVDSVRQITDSAAIEDGRSIVELPEGAGIARYTVVHVKADGKWLMSSVRDGRGEPMAAHSQLSNLDWLVGSWSTEQNDVKMEVNCRWIADKKFLERSHVVKRGDKVVTSGLQVIGWNPQAERIQSWSFTSDGGHAVGLWSQHKEGWAIESSGMTADGTPTESVNLVKPVDASAISWSSTARSAGGNLLPDLDEILLKRVAAKH